MMKMEQGNMYFDWVPKNMTSGQRLGVDENQIPASSFKMRSEMFEKSGITLVPVAGNLVDKVWADEKPPMPEEKVWILDEQYTGQSSESKFKDIADKLPEGCTSLLVTALDDIAWMLNLRGNDIEFNPLFFSYVIFQKGEETHTADLFVNLDKVSDVTEYLESINV